MFEFWRNLLVVATVVGALVTIGGLVAVFVSARREALDAERRVEKMRELSAAERAESSEASERRPRTPEESESMRVEAEARHARWEAEYERHGLVRPSYNNMVYLAAMESQRLLGLVLNSTRRDFIVAAVGLVVSTAASAGSLFLAA